MHGVFLDRDTLDPGDMDFSPLDEAMPDWRSYGNSTPAQVAARLQGAQVAISNKVMIDADTLAACPDLKLICISATGTNNVVKQLERCFTAAKQLTFYLQIIAYKTGSEDD